MADDDDFDSAEFSEYTIAHANKTNDMAKGAAGFGRAISQAFTRGIVDGKRFEDVLRSLAMRLSDLTLRIAMKPIESSISKGIEGVLGGIGGGGGGKSSAAFADGGVIASPSYFSLGQSTVGLAGEAGPEAILPLARGSDGRLGVASAGGGRAPNVTVNISTPDAGSFRQSEIYLSGMLARAVARGQRGL